MNIQELTDQYISDLGNYTKSQSNKEAFDNFKARGLPHTKMEDWLYTKLTDVLPESFKVTTQEAMLKNVKVAGKYQAVFLNGKYSKADSFLPEEITLEEVDLVAEDANCDEQDIFAMLNASAVEKVINITVPKNYVADDIISIVHLSDFEGEFSLPRIHVNADKFSKAEFVEIFTGSETKAYNISSVTNFKIADSANISHIKVQREGLNAFHAGSVNADIARDANFNSFTFTTGAKKSRNEIRVRMNEVGATCSVDGLYAINGEQHTDNFSLISHIKERTESSQLFKGVLDDKARGVFTGKVLVCRDAQLVNSEQLNKNLLLSKKAHVDTRPQLEVYADDVKCAHGATVGQMSDEEAFYLQSRGLSKERVQKLLIHAFCSDAIMKIENQKLQDFLSEILFDSFEKEAFDHLDQSEAK
ncbi:Fe-S cluster assembly protein SufD [Halobacteriovorax sp. DPLXC-1]|uniref:Fe-S cluster assembly protein SufD n=1 Tax=unclassified Halobacteriovorax TaxID=2639665 RepID=UPI002FF03B90